MRRLLSVAGAALLLLGAVAVPAAAHGDDGLIALETAPGSGPLDPRVHARVTYLNDGEVAPGATVSVEAVGPDGAVTPAVALADVGDGSYEATVALPGPGAWTLHATATTPAATAVVAYVATVPETTPRPTGTTSPRPDEPDDASASGSGSESESDDDGSDSGVVVIFVIAILIVAALAVGVSRSAAKRKRSGNTSTD